MSLQETLYNEQAALLQSRGFDEQNIGSPFRQKGFFDDLRRQIGKALNTIGTDEMPSGFSLKTIGSYGDDLVQFNFYYQFDPVKTILDIDQFEILWGPHQSKFKLNSSYDLPNAKSAFEQLKNETKQTKQQGKPVIIRTPKLYKNRRK